MTTRAIPAGWELRNGTLKPTRSIVGPQTLVFHAHVRAPKGAAASDPVLEAIVSSQSVDSYGDVVVQSGIDFSRFEKNPILTAQHAVGDVAVPAIGVAEKWWATEIEATRGGAKVPATGMRFRFYDDATTPLGQLAGAYLGLYRQGIMRSFSIHFAPVEGGARMGSEMDDAERQRYGVGEYGILWTRCQLLTVGAVTLPANADAVALSAASAATREEVAALRREVADLRRRLDAPPVPGAPSGDLTPAQLDEFLRTVRGA